MQYLSFFAARADTGAVLPYATATVKLSGTATLATLYNATSGSIGNPVSASVTGQVGFAAPDGLYDIVVASQDASYTAPTIQQQRLLDTAAGTASAQIGHIAPGTGSVARTVASALADGAISIKAKGATYSTADDSAAFVSAHADLTAGGTIYAPRGTFTLTSGVTLTNLGVRVRGDGEWNTYCIFNPATAAAAFTINEAATQGYFGSFEGMTFSSSSTVQKTAVEVFNGANFSLRNIHIPNGTWKGAGSIGARVHGRQLAEIFKLTIGTYRPLVLSPNAAFPTLADDFLKIDYCELVCCNDSGTLIGGGAKCLEIESGAGFSNAVIQNSDFGGGSYGIYYNDTSAVTTSAPLWTTATVFGAGAYSLSNGNYYQTTAGGTTGTSTTQPSGTGAQPTDGSVTWVYVSVAPPGQSFGLTLRNLRHEQSVDATGFSYYLASVNNGIKNILFDTVQTDIGTNGFYLRNVQRATFINCNFNSASGKTALDCVAVAGSVFTFINCYAAPGALLSRVGFKRVFSQVPYESADPFGPFEVWAYDDGTTGAGQVIRGGIERGENYTIAAGSGTKQPIADGTYVGLATITTDINVSCQVYFRGTTHSTNVISVSDAGFFSGALGNAGTMNIAWDAGTSKYVIENKQAAIGKVTVLLNGHATGTGGM